MTAPTDRPSFIVSSSSVPEDDAPYQDSNEGLSYGRRIGRAAGLQRMGVNIERLPPGRRTSWPHAEGDEEEFVYVLSGSVDAWVNGRLYPMSKGDIIAFPAGTGISHTVINNGSEDAELLVGGEKSTPGNRIFYPYHPHREAQVRPGEWWADVPAQEMGPHDGLPDAIRDGTRPVK